MWFQKCDIIRPLHSTVLLELQRGGWEGILSKPFPLTFCHSGEICWVLVLMAFTPTHSAPWSNLTLFRSIQRGRKKGKREMSCYHCKCLQKWEWPHRFKGEEPWFIRVGIFPMRKTSRKVWGIPQSAFRNITLEAVTASLCSHSPSCREAHCCCSVIEAVKAMSLGVHALLIILCNGKWTALQFSFLSFMSVLWGYVLGRQEGLCKQSFLKVMCTCAL